MSLLDDFNLLGIIQELATEEALKSQYHLLAAKHHPDKGGDPEKMSELSQAYKRCLAWVRLPKLCVQCDGVGTVLKGEGFTKISVLCPQCKGAKTT